MLTTARVFMASQREASKRVQHAENFSLRLPIVGRVSMPPPDQLAFFGVLGLLAAVELIDWPVALAIGIGQAVVARHFDDEHAAAKSPDSPVEAEPAVAAPPRKATARKATPKKAAPRKATAGKAAPRKTAAGKATPRKAAKSTPAKAAKSTKR